MSPWALRHTTPHGRAPAEGRRCGLHGRRDPAAGDDDAPGPSPTAIVAIVFPERRPPRPGPDGHARDDTVRAWVDRDERVPVNGGGSPLAAAEGEGRVSPPPLRRRPRRLPRTRSAAATRLAEAAGLRPCPPARPGRAPVDRAPGPGSESPAAAAGASASARCRVRRPACGAPPGRPGVPPPAGPTDRARASAAHAGARVADAARRAPRVRQRALRVCRARARPRSAPRWPRDVALPGARARSPRTHRVAGRRGPARATGPAPPRTARAPARALRRRPRPGPHA